MFNFNHLFSRSASAGGTKESRNNATTKKGSATTNTRIPKDVQESIPYRSVYPNGIIEDLNGWYSRSYEIEDANFQTENEEKKTSMFMEYESLLNSISTGQRAQLLIFNRSIDADSVRNSILMKPAYDGVNHLRDEWNDLFLSKMQKGRNNLKKDKIFTVSVNASDIVEANDALNTLDQTVTQAIRRINHAEVRSMSIEDRLKTLYDIYNHHADLSFDRKISPVLKNGRIDFNMLGKYGISSKDLIGPDSMDFYRNNFRLGDAYCSAFYVEHLPTVLNTDFLNNLSNISCNMLLSVTYTPMDQELAMSMIRNQDTAVNAQIADMQRKSQGFNYIPAELENAKIQARELMRDVLARDQKIFKVTITVVLIADSQEELKQHTSSLRSIVSSHLCHLRKLTNQQELAFNTALPLAENQVALDRVLTTESASVFIPFTVQELCQPDGCYYGLNAISKNMIRYNRRSGSNYNGLILGKSGSGKSFITKEEIMQRFLNSDDRIIIIDPEGEYTKLGEALGGTVIKIDSTNKVSINPLDMDMQYAGEGENPISMKSDYILGLIETMVGGEGILSAVDKNIIQRVIRQIYRPYYEYMKSKVEHGITCDKSAMPTLGDLYERLIKQPEPSAQIIATAIENYCVGCYDTFAHRTNVDTDNRLIIYNVKDMLSGMKELAMQVCMNDAWNHMIENGKKGLYTDLYIDEFHLFTKTKTSAAFMKNIYKRARKWKGVPTAITQNYKDLLINDESKAIVDNCDFIIMMNQSPTDRSKLAADYQISTSLQEYITDKGHGMGIIYNGKTLIPFENVFDDENSESFRIMDSRVGQ